MKTPGEIKNILDQHEQKRPFSCFQSAVEMVLKLNEVIAQDEYPEQSVDANDGRGYEPFSGKTKHYGRVAVCFEEIKFDPFGSAIDKGRELLEDGLYPIYSFEWPSGGFHGFVAFTNETGGISFFTKTKLGILPADRYELNNVLPQKKTEILVVRVLP